MILFCCVGSHEARAEVYLGGAACAGLHPASEQKIKRISHDD